MCDTWSDDMTHLPLTPPSSPALQSRGLLSPLSAAVPSLFPPAVKSVGQCLPMLRSLLPSSTLQTAECPPVVHASLLPAATHQLASGSIQPAINVL